MKEDYNTFSERIMTETENWFQKQLQHNINMLNFLIPKYDEFSETDKKNLCFILCQLSKRLNPRSIYVYIDGIIRFYNRVLLNITKNVSSDNDSDIVRSAHNVHVLIDTIEEVITTKNDDIETILGGIRHKFYK